MIVLEYPFKIIKSKTCNTSLGVVGFSEEPFNIQGLKDDIAEVVGSFGDSLRRAYDVRTVVEQPKKALLSTRVIPVEAQLNKKEADIVLEYCPDSKTIRRIGAVIKRMDDSKKENAIFVKDDNLYFFQKLKKNFDSESTGYMLKALKGVLLNYAGQKYKNISMETTPDYLKVEAEIEIPRDLSI